MPFVDMNVLNLDTPMGRELTQYMGQDRAEALARRLSQAASERNIDLLPSQQDPLVLGLLVLMQMNDLEA